MIHNASSVLSCDDTSVYNDVCEYDEYTAMIPDDTLITRINTLKEQVDVYQQRAKFELTMREQKMDWQMCDYITKSNQKEEALRNEIKSLQKQVVVSVKQKQEIEESVVALKLDFQNEKSKHLSDFSNLKALKN